MTLFFAPPVADTRRMLAYLNTPNEAAPVARREVEEPRPAAHEALVEVHAFSLNRGELALLERRPAGWRPGQDVAGIIAAQAADGSGPPAGTRIVGLVEGSGFAERVAVRTIRMATLPAAAKFEDAAALPIPGLTALRALRRGGLLLDTPVMITGATGIVGALAVRHAADAGARVSATFNAPDARTLISAPCAMRTPSRAQEQQP